MDDFVARNKNQWQELEQLSGRARKRRWLRRMGPEEIHRLDILYRRTAVHLAQVVTRTQDKALARYLNDLTAAAHAIIYLPPRRSMLADAGSFFSEGFAAAVARSWRFQLAAVLLFVAGATIGYVASVHDQLAAYAILPAGESRQIGAGAEQLMEHLRHGRDMGGDRKFHFASFLFQHNVKVGAMALVTGVLAAVPTILLMLYNGMTLGAFTAIHHLNHIHTAYWAWILPHGVTELPAAILCGGAGLQIGWGVLAPGWRSRAEALRLAGAEAVRILLGAAAMLLLSAGVESYLRQSHLSDPGRLLFAAALGAGMLAYFSWGAWREHASLRRA